MSDPSDGGAIASGVSDRRLVDRDSRVTSPQVDLLLVCDDEAITERILGVLRDGGYEVNHSYAADRNAFRKALATQKIDVIVSLLELERFDGFSALAILREQDKETPLFIIAETMEVERAVCAMRAGASDCFQLDALDRFIPSFSQELRGHGLRRSRQSAAAAPRYSDLAHRASIDAMGLGSWEWMVDSGQMIWSERAKKIFRDFGLEAPDNRDAYVRLILEQDVEAVQQATNLSLTRGQLYEVAHRLRNGAGEIQWVGVKGFAPIEAEGRAKRMTGTISDITVRMRANEEVRKREMRYRSLFEDSPIALVSFSSSGAILTTNKMATALFDLPTEELLGRPFLDLLALSSGDTWTTMLRATREGQSTESVTLDFENPGGSRWSGQVTVKPEKDDAGATVGRAFIATRATDLGHGSVPVDQLLALVQDSVFICDRNGHVYQTNVFENGEAVQSLEAVLGREGLDEIAPRLQDAADGESQVGEVSVSTGEVDRRQVRFNLAPFRKNGVPSEVIAVFHPITGSGRASTPGLKNDRSGVRTANALERLAGGIAHDFNNLLLAILGYAELTRDDLPNESPLRSNVDHILSAGERAQRLVKQILQFGRRTERTDELLEVQLVVREAVSYLRASLPTNVEIHEDLDEAACVIRGDAKQIQQALVNVATNAAHAMQPDGGALMMTVRGVHLDGEHVESLGDLMPGEYVQISVSDTGHGMPEDVLQRIYDPFFTTKGVGQGSGLGMSVVHGIVLSHQGAIHTTSEIDQGTRVDVYFPRTEVAHRVAEPRLSPPLRAGARVLFVDDEQPLALLGKTILERQGYVVTAATRGREALDYLIHDPADFDVLVTDQSMPEMTGLELAAKVRGLRPELPIVLTTGFSAAVTTEGLMTHGIAALVMKPYESAELCRAIRDALLRGQMANIG